MTDKEIEAGIERACECDCAPPSTGWTVNPFPIIRDYIERLKHRAEVEERALVIIAERVLEYAQKAKVTAMTSGGLFSYDKDAQLALLVNDALLKAEQKMARKENNESDF